MKLTIFHVLTVTSSRIILILLETSVELKLAYLGGSQLTNDIDTDTRSLNQ